ncbi:MAG: metallophosphoesterase [Terriglobales bacterium]
MRISRRKFLRNSLAAAVGAAVPLAAYSQFIEPHELTIGRLELPIVGLPEAFDGFRIAQLSDFHYLPYTRRSEIEKAVQKTNSLSPDLTVLTGDFITSDEDISVLNASSPVYSHMGVCAELVSHLRAAHGVIACPGNHDTSIGIPYVRGALGDFGIPLLVNESRAVERDGGRIWIAGVDDAIYGKADFGRALAKIPAGETVILLAHEPDLADEASRHPIALQLSGHSHGGQIRLPIIGCPYLPPLAEKYPYGYYRIGKMHLYTNRGIGEILLPYRFNAPPEITLVTLRQAR